MINTNLSIECRIKADVILKPKNAVIIVHSIFTEFMNKAFRLKKACTQLPASQPAKAGFSLKLLFL